MMIRRGLGNSIGVIVSGLKSVASIVFSAVVSYTASIYTITTAGIGQLNVMLSGETVTNIADFGDCESASGWDLYLATVATDSANKLFGTNCLKITAQATACGINRDIKSLLDITKYYLITAHVKNGNLSGSGIRLELYAIGDGGGQASSFVTSTAYDRKGLLLQPSDFDGASIVRLAIGLDGTSGQYGYVDGIFITEITSTEYALGATALMLKYSTTFSTTDTSPQRVLSITKNQFDKNTVTKGYKVVYTTGALSALIGYNASDYIRLGTYLSLSGLTNTTTKEGAYYDKNKVFISGFSTYGNNQTIPTNAVYVRFTIIEADLTLAQSESATASTTYVEFSKTQSICPVSLASVPSIKDTFDCLTGEHTRNIVENWVTLSGNAFTWGSSSTYDGLSNTRLIYATNSSNTGIASSASLKVIKYNGKVLDAVLGQYTSDNAYLSSTVGRTVIGVSDTDSGWDDTWEYATSFTGMTWANLIKAYMNGWKLTTANVNVASCVWTGIVSGTTKTGASGYTDVTTIIDTGFTPYKMKYQLATPVVTYYPTRNFKNGVATRTLEVFGNNSTIIQEPINIKEARSTSGVITLGGTETLLELTEVYRNDGIQHDAIWVDVKANSSLNTGTRVVTITGADDSKDYLCISSVASESSTIATTTESHVL
jgi:hypothetical protein